MKTIRQLYVYAVAMIGVEVVIWGTVGLLRSIFGTQDIQSSSSLAQALALILVGVPIFLIHWVLAQKAAAKDPEERSSTLRALFLYGILLGTLLPSVQQLLALVNRAMLRVAQLSGGLAIVGGTQSWEDNVIAIVANLAAAAYFFSILKGNRAELAGAEHERLEKAASFEKAAASFEKATASFDDVRRLYRVVWVEYLGC